MIDEFTIRGEFAGHEAVAYWREGELVDAPDDLREAVAETIATRRLIHREIAMPWVIHEEASPDSMTERWMAQSILLALFEPGTADLDDPVLRAEQAEWAEHERRGGVH